MLQLFNKLKVNKKHAQTFDVRSCDTGTAGILHADLTNAIVILMAITVIVIIMIIIIIIIIIIIMIITMAILTISIKILIMVI